MGEVLPPTKATTKHPNNKANYKANTKTYYKHFALPLL
jgi:hypothetical protein